MNQFWAQFNLAGEDPTPVPAKFQVRFGPCERSSQRKDPTRDFVASDAGPCERSTVPTLRSSVSRSFFPFSPPSQGGVASQDRTSAARKESQVHSSAADFDPFAAFQAKQSFSHKLQFDGGAAPNPGPACSGAILFTPDGKPVIERGLFHSRATNNYAEYMGLILGLALAKEQGVRFLEVEGDSMLVVKQMNGQYKVTDPSIAILYKKAKEASRHFESFKIRHIYREHNTEADRITKLGVRTRANHERVY